MEKSSRLIVIVLIAVVALVGGFAAGALLTGDRDGQAGASATPEALATATPGETEPTEEPTQEPTEEAPTDETEEPSEEATPGATPAQPATATITQLFLDAQDNPAGADRVITWKSATGKVTADVATVSPMGDVVMCLATPAKELGCRTAGSGQLSASTTKSSETFILTLRGADIAQPIVDVTLNFQAKKPKVTIENARFDGTAYPETNGIQVVVTPRVNGTLGVAAEWGGKPFLYEVDVIEQGGSGSLTYAPEESSIGTDVDFAVTAPNPWKVILQNTQDGFGITPMTAVVTWP
jgi:hypothetical protein